MEAVPRQHGLGLRRPGLRALWALAAFAMAAGTASAQHLIFHSIGAPPDIYSLASDWYMAGTTIPSTRTLVISPGVPGRVGMLWSRSPIFTNDFEVVFSITAQAPKSRTVKNDGFAFWYVYENGTSVHETIAFDHAQKQEELMANTWHTHFEAAGLDLMGYRSKFDGLGVFFHDDEQPTVSAVMNNGQQTVKVGETVPIKEPLKVNWRSGAEITVKLRIQPNQATVDIPGVGAITIKSAFKAQGYIGITSLSGDVRIQPYEPTERTNFVELRHLDVENKDVSQQGEEAHAPTVHPPAEKEDEKVDVLHESSSFSDHRAESDAIKDLTNMVFKLVVESQPMRQQMSRALDSLGKRVAAMEKSFADLKSELDKKSGHKLGVEFDAIKKELTDLSNVASKETKERHKRLDNLHLDIADVHKSAHSSDSIDKHLDKLTVSHTKVLDQLTSEHQRMFGFSILAIAFIIIAGLSLYNKFRCWEKKHVL